MRRALWIPALLSAGLALTACSADVDHGSQGGERTTTVSSPIINGEFDDGTKNDSVVLIETELPGGKAAGCSGTLVAPNVVFTARHCVSRTDDYSKAVYEDHDPAKMMIWLGNAPRFLPDGHVARIVHDSATNLYDSDFAILILKTGIGTMISPMRLASAPEKYETVNAVGYGLTTSDTSTPTGLHKRYRREGLKIQMVGPMPTYGLGAHEFIIGESICSGDSGGPIFDSATGALLGVVSRGGNGKAPTASQPWAACVGTSTINIFTRVDAYTDFIKKTMAEAGATPWEEGAPKPEPPPPPPPPELGKLGADCGGPGDCASNLCVDWAGKRVCSQECSDATPCPAGFDCLGGFCIASGSDPTPAPDPGATPGNETVKSGCSSAPRSQAPGREGFLALGLSVAAVIISARRRSRLR